MTETTPSKPQDRPLLAMVCLAEADLPSPESLKKAWQALWPDQTCPLTDIRAEAGKVTFAHAGNSCSIGLIEAPIPWQVLEGPCATAWYWPEARETLEAHRAHLVVYLAEGEGRLLLRSLLFTRLVALVAQASDSLGVYWGAGPLINECSAFIAGAAAATPKQLPLQLWVEFRPIPGPGERWSLYTSGLASLGVMEIEVRESSWRPERLADFVFNIAHYQLDHGAVIKDGDTVGGSAEEKIRAWHAASKWDRAGPVLHLDIA